MTGRSGDSRLAASGSMDGEDEVGLVKGEPVMEEQGFAEEVVPKGTRCRVEHDTFDRLRVWDAAVQVQFDSRPDTPRVQCQFDEAGVVAVQVRFASAFLRAEWATLRAEAVKGGLDGILLAAVDDWMGDRSGGRHLAAYDYPREGQTPLDVGGLGTADLIDEASPERVAEKRSALLTVRVLCVAVVVLGVITTGVYGPIALAMLVVATLLGALAIGTFLVTFPHYGYWVRRALRGS